MVSETPRSALGVCAGRPPLFFSISLRSSPARRSSSGSAVRSCALSWQLRLTAARCGCGSRARRESNSSSPRTSPGTALREAHEVWLDACGARAASRPSWNQPRARSRRRSLCRECSRTRGGAGTHRNRSGLIKWALKLLFTSKTGRNQPGEISPNPPHLTCSARVGVTSASAARE